MTESPKFQHPRRNQGWGTQRWHQI